MLWMIGMALLLGIRHGLDLDHLATIDAMTRLAKTKIVGLLFSLGHGLVVIVLSFILGAGLIQAHVPSWLDQIGSWISIFFLVLFGLINLKNVLHHPTSEESYLGFKAFLAKKLIKKKLSPHTIIGIGALFALSFDTVSQVALFSLSASLVSGYFFSILLGFSFMIGMMLSDGINGMLIATLLKKANKGSLLVSRCLGLAISVFSLSLGCYSLFSLLST